MEKIIIVTDTGCDLPKDNLIENNVEYLELTYILDGVEYSSFQDEVSFSEFYDRVSKGAKTSTSCINETTFEEKFLSLAKDGSNVLYLAFSSGLSATYDNAVKASKTVNEKLGDDRITVFDTKGASCGHGYLVLIASRLAKEGRSVGFIVNELKHTKIMHRFTVADLMHLKRGGRLSGFSAVVGSMLKVQPMLVCDNADGKLKVVDKIMGKKAVNPYFIKKMMAEIDLTEDKPFIIIAHAECLPNAETLKSDILKHIPNASIVINYIGHVIGSHCGKGTLAVFYKSK